jgi:hypothetical protein
MLVISFPGTYFICRALFNWGSIESLHEYQNQNLSYHQKSLLWHALMQEVANSVLQNLGAFLKNEAGAQPATARIRTAFL